MKAYRGSGGIAPIILSGDLHTPREVPLVSNEWVLEPVWTFQRSAISLATSGNGPLHHPARSQLITLTELSQFSQRQVSFCKSIVHNNVVCQ